MDRARFTLPRRNAARGDSHGGAEPGISLWDDSAEEPESDGPMRATW
ncbi:hypothetical protein [Roseovarius sp. THAF8]|nr:hypothetical protein [Roseovarius sp. THAF8]